ncbi:ubiquitin carboxyl-terminal hydrolase-domain-containing protein [Syncephalis plumigaleata]|nr:ubiquitin carboxyl-terminal hydrolase-domain-containing protein [Syncephalis plumigaleata]
MANGWTQLASICDADVTGPTAAMTPVAVTAAVFDYDQELLWTGNERGRVTSYVGTGIHKYTSFRAHVGPVRQLMSVAAGVLSVGPNSVQLTHRRGLVQWTISDPNLTQDLYCMTTSTLRHSDVIVAGRQRTALLVNVDRGTITRKFDCDSDIVVLRRSRLVCCGTASGEVMLRDPRSFRVEHAVQAHTGALSDIAVTENLIMTCGFSDRHGDLVIDPLVKVYDIRTMRSLMPISFPAGPSFLKLDPNGSSQMVMVAQDGQFQWCNVAIPSVASLHYYRETTSSFVTAFDVAPSGNMACFGDAESVVTLWGRGKDPQVNAAGQMPEMADSIAAPLPNSLSLVGMPYYDESLLSVWPSHMVFEVGRPVESLDLEVLNTMKMVDFVGYAPNPGTRLRNQVSSSYRKYRTADTPRFRSERDKGRLHSGAHTMGLSKDTLQDGELSDVMSEEERRQMDQYGWPDMSARPVLSDMPDYYRKVEIKYSKFGVEDFDFEYYNRLETHITNSYCNSELQLLRFLPGLSSMTKLHITQSCSKQDCLCCELGFLFRMLEASDGANCQANNFLRSFNTIPQVEALGLFEPEIPEPRTSYSALIQNFNRFILEQLHQECDLTLQMTRVDTEQSPIQQLFGIATTTQSQCQCGHMTLRDSTPFTLDLSYTLKDTGRCFTQVVRDSLVREQSTRAWCDECRQYQPSKQWKRLHGLPIILNINSSLYKREDRTYWRCHTNGELDVRDVTDATLDPDEALYETYGIFLLSSVISQVQPEKELPHLVAQIKVSNDKQNNWYLFNDFLVRQIPKEQVLDLYSNWKLPAVLCYIRENTDDLLRSIHIPQYGDTSILFKNITIAKQTDLAVRKHQQLSRAEHIGQGTLCAIDAEFVLLSEEKTELNIEGVRVVVRPNRLSLARVSVVRGDGELEGVPFIDDYIASVEPVVNYLTEFSGIEPDDLDPELSRHNLVTLKTAYKKLRLLLDMGCIFVGHGLKKDFRIINLLVPPEQVIDTVDLFHLKNRQRKISLRFLAWYLLGEAIQTSSHDSIEDARMALLLYKKYLELTQKGIFQSILEEIYAEGWRRNWKVGEADTMTSLELFLASKSLSSGSEASDTSILEESDHHELQQEEHADYSTYDNDDDDDDDNGDNDSGTATMTLKQSSHELSPLIDLTESSCATTTINNTEDPSDKLAHSAIDDTPTILEAEGTGPMVIC